MFDEFQILSLYLCPMTPSLWPWYLSPLAHCSRVSRLKVEDFSRDLGCCADRGLEKLFWTPGLQDPEKMATKLATCGSISSPICRTSGQNWGNSWGKTRWQFWLFWLSSKLMNLSIYFSISVVYFHFHPTFWNVMLVHIAPVHRRLVRRNVEGTCWRELKAAEHPRLHASSRQVRVEPWHN